MFYREKYDSLSLHTNFVVRKFRQGLSPQSPLDHVFSQVLFYDQARLRIFDSRSYEQNRKTALDVFFLKTPKTLDKFPGNPRLHRSTLTRHRSIFSRALLRKLEKTLWLNHLLSFSILTVERQKRERGRSLRLLLSVLLYSIKLSQVSL